MKRTQFELDTSTPVARLAQHAAVILEWLELTTECQAADLAVSCFGATTSAGEARSLCEIEGISAEGETMAKALKAWAGHVLRHLEDLNGVDPLVTWLLAFGNHPADKFHAITLAAVNLGVGSRIDPTLPAQRCTSHFHEIQMFGVLGRGDSLASAIDNWRDAALADLPSRVDALPLGLAA
jgi:predicted RNase H-like HicB family nuclease